jgi:hypothetical protein
MIQVELGQSGIIFDAELSRLRQRPLWTAWTDVGRSEIIKATGKTPMDAIRNLKQKFYEES